MKILPRLNAIHLLLVLAFAGSGACTKKEPEPNKLLVADWGKIIVNPTIEQNKRHWDLWKSKSVKHYRYKTKITCDGCTLETYNKQLVQGDTRLAKGTSWMIVEVSNNQVILVTNIDGSPNQDFKERLEIFKSDMIAQAFKWIEADARYEFNTRVAIYDTVYGFPHYAEILPSEKGPTDVGHRIEIIEFEVLPEMQNEAGKELKINQ